MDERVQRPAGLLNVTAWWGQHRHPRATSLSGTRHLCRHRHATVWLRQLCCLTTAHWVCRTWDGAVVRRHDVRCVPGAGWTSREMSMMETLLVDFQRSQEYAFHWLCLCLHQKPESTRNGHVTFSRRGVLDIVGSTTHADSPVSVGDYRVSLTEPKVQNEVW